MSLKTSDKIIAIIGVIILIGAGVGIYLYWVSDEDTKEPMEPEDEYVTYNIVPTLKDGESIKKTFTFSKSLLLLSKVNFDNNKFFQISEDNIISININVTYNDGVVGILQKKDTVNVIITDPDGGKHSCNNVEGTKKIKPIEEEVVVFDEEDPLKIIEYLMPDVLVKGGDWTEDKIIGADVVKAAGGKVKTIPFIEGYSTTDLINRLREL